jgi:hypothetical protein
MRDTLQKRGRKRADREEPTGESNLRLCLGGAIALVGPVLSLSGFLQVRGKAGFPVPNHGAQGYRYVAMSVVLLVGCAILVHGLVGIKNKYITSGWRVTLLGPREYTGNLAVVVGMGQCFLAGICLGMSLYGFVF